MLAISIGITKKPRTGYSSHSKGWERQTLAGGNYNCAGRVACLPPRQKAERKKGQGPRRGDERWGSVHACETRKEERKKKRSRMIELPCTLSLSLAIGRVAYKGERELGSAPPFPSGWGKTWRAKGFKCDKKSISANRRDRRGSKEMGAMQLGLQSINTIQGLTGATDFRWGSPRGGPRDGSISNPGKGQSTGDRSAPRLDYLYTTLSTSQQAQPE